MHLRPVLLADAVTCIAAGLALSLFAAPLEPVLGLPFSLLQYAGLALLPIGAFIGAVASRSPTPAAGVRVVVAGNALWATASLAVLLWLSPTALGVALVSAQALAVAGLAALEHRLLLRAAAARAWTAS